MRVVGECFFWYRLTRVFPDKFHRAVKRLCVCVLSWTTGWAGNRRNIHPLHLSWLSTFLYQLPPSTTICSILPVQFTCLTVFCTTSLQSCIDYPFVWNPSLHTPYISSPNHCLLFATHAHTIAHRNLFTKIVSSNPSLSVSTVYLELYLLHHFILTSLIHLTILISARWSATSLSFLTGQCLTSMQHSKIAKINSCGEDLLLDFLQP